MSMMYPAAPEPFIRKVDCVDGFSSPMQKKVLNQGVSKALRIVSTPNAHIEIAPSSPTVSEETNSACTNTSEQVDRDSQEVRGSGRKS